MSTAAGRHFLLTPEPPRVPEPSNVPDRAPRIIERAAIDRCSPEFGALGTRVLAGLHDFVENRSGFPGPPSSGAGA